MELSPAAGKIIGMLMAYAVSSLGMLLAYINYRKRIIKADTIFTPAARNVIISIITVAVVGTILTATAATSGTGKLGQAIAENFLGLALPAFIVLVSIALTWMLYRHFARRMEG